ncbi:MAG: hypothetical protein CVT88_02645 [Candidatus Altiarchaeales archaeon HGW-Altiarchaeales-1]|nr:MAG: hypothetical protein CVT88_02645 [Candidatus Altiarchaeales archaeon HGW-Altiarchaeales-1]
MDFCRYFYKILQISFFLNFYFLNFILSLSSRINYYGTSTTMGGGIKVPMQNMYVRTANMSEH